jgi:hypothetical protein
MSNRTAKALANVETAVAELRAALEAEDDQVANDDRWQRLLTMVEDAGGTVTGDEWRDLGLEVGYKDVRGLGGFYRGTGASMRVNPDGTRSLTAAGADYLNKYGRR